MMHAALTRYVLWGTLVSLGGVVLVALVACGTAGCGPARGSGAGGADLVHRVSTFIIFGHTGRRMSPGVTVPLNLHLRNHNGFRLSAAHLRVTIRTVHAPRADGAHPCSVRDFTVDQPSRRLRVALAPHRTTSLRLRQVSRKDWPHVTMRNRPVNQDGCQGATLTLHYTATGTRVGR